AEMQRRTVQDPQRRSSAAPRWAARGTVAKPGRPALPPARPTGRGPVLRWAAALVAAAAALIATAPPGAAQQPCAQRDHVMVIEVDGLVDPVLADLVDDQVAAAA